MTPLSFEDYCRAVREADVQFILTRRATDPWRLYFVQSDALAVQFGSDGGASIADGTVSSANYTLIGRHHPSEAEIFCNGEFMRPHDFVLIPPGARFIFAGSAARTWLAVMVPAATFEAICGDLIGHRIDNRRPSILRLSHQSNFQIISQCESLRNLAKGGATPADTLAAVVPLMDTVRTILLDKALGSRAVAENWKSTDVVFSALDAVRQIESFEDLYVEDLAIAAHVHPRTLLRAFHSVIGMGPVRYLRYRQLNILRRHLCAENNFETVTEAMQAVGVSDMGRISGAYRVLFGEMPSETLRARRRATVD